MPSPKRGRKSESGVGFATRAVTLLVLLVAAGALYWVATSRKASSRAEHATVTQETAAAQSAAGGSSGGSGSASQEEEADMTPLNDAQRAAIYVSKLLKKHRVMIFSKSYCPYSMRGKDVMRRHVGAGGMHVVELDRLDPGSDPDMAVVQDELARITGARTVPRIFVDGEFIGGADDVSAKEHSGELERLLQQKGLLAHASA